MRQVQQLDAMLEGDAIRYGTALHRINEIVEDQPMDQESAEFHAGDVRDVLRLCDEKSFQEVRDKVKGKPTGESVTLTLSQCRPLVAAALKPQKNKTPAT